jgi:diguanylate cyclase (GGDEF)-like protein
MSACTPSPVSPGPSHGPAQPAPPAEPALAAGWERSPLRLNKADIALFQALGVSAPRCACLVAYNGQDTGRRIALDGPLTVIGRAPECEAQFDSPGLSRRHAELQVAGDTVTLRDLGSANGTHVNGVRLDTTALLQDGDRVELGDLVLKFFGRHSLEALLRDRAYREATLDPGTDLYSRRYMLEVLQRETQAARRTGSALCVVALDLDRFRAVNERWGQVAGDTVLRHAAHALQGSARASDTLGRLGGQEFLAVMPATRLPAARQAAERMRLALAARTIGVENAANLEKVVLHQTASLGVVQFEPAMRNARDLLGAAEALVQAAKRAGRNCVR